MLDVKINKISRDVHNLGQRSNSSDLKQINKKYDDDTKNQNGIASSDDSVFLPAAHQYHGAPGPYSYQEP